MNDVLDARYDRFHPVKRFRPVAAGDVSAAGAIVFALSLWILAAGMLYLAGCPVACIFFVLGYIVMNVLYSAVLKSVPVLDVSIVVFGFVVRAVVGSAACGVSMSPWLYLSVLSVSSYLVLRKRLAEFRTQFAGTYMLRDVLSFYSERLLQDHSLSCRTMAVVFYALWSISPDMGFGSFGPYLPVTVPLVMIGMFRYDQVSDLSLVDDVVEVILHDRFLLCVGLVFAVMVGVCLYAG